MKPMTPALSPSLDVIKPSAIRELANIAFAMDDVKALHFGESDMPTPGYIGMRWPRLCATATPSIAPMPG